MGKKIPFSGKQKKEQLQQKRDRKAKCPVWTADDIERKEFADAVNHRTQTNKPRPKNNMVQTVPNRSTVAPKHNKAMHSRTRYRMDFGNEKNDDESKKQNFLPYITGQWADLEYCSTSIFPSHLDFPKRPKWDSSVSKQELDETENRYITEFINQYNDKEEVSRFERNLETWRQLWRVCEKSDILLIIVDARFAIAQFPPYLYRYIKDELRKGVILIVNKCDLIPNNCLTSLRDYFKQCFPDMSFVPFSSGKFEEKWSTTAEKILQLIAAIKRNSKVHVNFDKWKRNIRSCKSIQHGDLIDTTNDEESASKTVLTIGTIGYPNVGKSSFINTINRKKVVSVSKTPGHTKHFQTIYLAGDVILCDCPGLVFPSTTPFPLQVIMGSYPISQVRNPMAVIGYICQYLNVPEILKLTIPEDSSANGEWTPFSVCESFAIQKNFNTKNGRPDVYRGANLLLRDIVAANNNVIFYIRPPGSSYKDKIGVSKMELAENQTIPENAKMSAVNSNSEEEDSESDEESTGMQSYSNRFSSLDI